MNETMIIDLIQKEFDHKRPLFRFSTFRFDQLSGPAYQAACLPGVYVLFNEDLGCCMRTGISKSNAPIRAMRHIRDNTTSKDGRLSWRRDYDGHPSNRLLIINMIDDCGEWYLSALEGFLETTLAPTLQPKRRA